MLHISSFGLDQHAAQHVGMGEDRAFLKSFLPKSGDLGIALQAAHDSLPSTGGCIDVSGGYFVSSTPAVFNKPILLTGRGAGSTRLGTNSPSMKLITTSAKLVAQDISFTYDGPPSAQNGCEALNLGGAFGHSLQRCFFDRWDIAVEYTAAQGVMAAHCRFWDNKTYGLKISNVASPDTGDHELCGLQFAQSLFPNAPAAIYWNSSGGLKIVGGKFLEHAYSLLCDINDGVNTKILSVTGASMEGMRSGAIRVARPSAGTTGTLNSVIINGNQFGGRGTWGATPKIVAVGAGVSDVVINNNVFEGSGSAGNCGIYVEDNFLGGGVIDGNEFFDINTAIHDPAQGSGIIIGRNSYKGTCAVRHEGAGNSGASRGGVETIVSDLTAWNPTQLGTWYYLYKIHIPANQTADIRVSWNGIQNGAGGASRYRHFIAFNNGGSISLTDIVANTTVGTVTSWSEYTGVVGTSSGDDGVAIGIKPALNQPAQGELRIEVSGVTSKIRKLSMLRIRTSTYKWTLSAGGTTEYYLTKADGSDPAIQFPAVVLRNAGTAGSQNYVQTARGTVGSLAADRWGYGNNDGLSFSTIYVRLPDGTSPDANITDYLMAFS